jgi:hypothetical protein
MTRPRFGDVVVDIYGDETTPLVDVSAPERSVQHVRIGKPPKKQDLGPGLREYRIRGECLGQTADSIDELRGEISVRAERVTVPRAFVERTETAPLEKRYEGERVFEYLIELTEVVE